MKTLKLKSLSMLLVVLISTMPLWAESSKNLDTKSITTSRTYSAEQVIKLVEEITADAEDAISESYAEGYKAATLELLPEIEYQKALNERLQKESLAIEKAHRKGRWTAGLIGGGTGLVVATVACSLIFGMVN